MRKRWRIAPLRVGLAMYWVAFYCGYRIGRSTDLGRLMGHIAKAEQSDDDVYRSFVGEQW